MVSRFVVEEVGRSVKSMIPLDPGHTCPGIVLHLRNRKEGVVRQEGGKLHYNLYGL